MAYWLTAFAGVSVPTNLGDRGSMDVAAGSADAPLIALPGGRVFDPLGSDSAYRPSAQFAAHVMVVSNTPATIKSVVDAWQALIGKVGTLTRTADSGGATQTITARLLSANIVNRRLEGSKIVRMDMIFQAIALPWSGSAISTLLASGTVSTHLYTGTVTNNGNVQQNNIIVTISCSAATISTITITNTTTGVAFTYTASLAVQLIVNTSKRTVLNNGAADYAHFTPSTTHENWMELAPGANTITYQATFVGAGSYTVQFDSYEAWG